MTSDLRFRAPAKPYRLDDSHANFYVVHCMNESSPVYIRVAIDMFDEVYLCRKDLSSLSLKFKHHIQKWIPEADVFHIFNRFVSLKLRDDILDGLRQCLTEHEQRREFRQRAKVVADTRDASDPHPSPVLHSLSEDDEV